MATVPVPRTWTVDDTMTVTRGNEFRDMHLFLLNLPRVTLRRSAVLSIPNTGNTAVQWDTKDVDTANGFSTSNNTRYTIQYPGRYTVILTIGFAASATGHRTVLSRINGSTVYTLAQVGNAGASVPTWVSGAFQIPYVFTVDEYFEILVAHAHSAALDVVAESYVSAQWEAS